MEPREDRREVVDLTGTGEYTLASESPDQRRYQFPGWIVAVGALLLVAIVLAMVAFA